MGIVFNPFSGNFDFTGSSGGGGGGSSSWGSAVATEAALPGSASDGDVKVTLDTDYIWVYDSSTSRWINTGIKSASVGSTPGAAGYTLDYVNVSSNRREFRLTLQPADGSNPGVITAGAQTIGGAKTFSSTIAASNLSGTNTGDISLAAVGSSPNANSASLSGQTLNLQPADGSNPGVLTSGTQSIGGVKTFNARVNADAGLDISAAGTLNIGANTATTINIGKSGSTINIIGSTTYEQVTNLQVADKLVTINKGGAASSGSSTGIEIEENSSITGYVQTSGDRNSWLLKAPNTAGDVTLTPGAGGITLNQSSHDPVTLGTANGLSLSTQALSLQLSSTSLTGALSSTDWNTFNNKQSTVSFTAVGSSPNSNGAVISTGAITLEPADATNPGVVTTAAQTFGGTKTFDNIIDSGLTASTVPYADGSKQLVSSTVTPTELGYVSGVTSAIQTQLGNKQPLDSTLTSLAAYNTNGILTQTAADTFTGRTITAGSGISVSNGDGVAGNPTISLSVAPSTGDISETSFTAANNQSSAANVTGLAFANGTVRSFFAIVSIVRNASYEQYELNGIQRGSDWEMSQEILGDDAGLTFSITTAGQVQYTSTNTGFTAALKFRAMTTSV